MAGKNVTKNGGRLPGFFSDHGGAGIVLDKTPSKTGGKTGGKSPATPRKSNGGKKK